MQSIIPSECLTAWTLRLNLYQIAETKLETDPAYTAALADLRTHMDHCQQCLDYLRFHVGRAAPLPVGEE